MDFLAAAAGTIIGVSLSPEVWVVGIVAGLTIRRIWILLAVALAASMVIQMIVRSMQTEAGMVIPLDHAAVLVFARFVGILIFAFAALGIRRLVRRASA
jgi:hypothetical protein